MSGYGSDRIQWEWLIFGAAALAVFVLMAPACAAKIRGETAIATEVPAETNTPETRTPEPDPESLEADILDYGRFEAPVPGQGLDNPAGAVIVYFQPTSDIGPQVEKLDDLAITLIRDGDTHFLYFDTLDNGVLYSVTGCPVGDILNPPADVHERACSRVVFSSFTTPYIALRELGFVSYLLVSTPADG